MQMIDGAIGVGCLVLTLLGWWVIRLRSGVFHGAFGSPQADQHMLHLLELAQLWHAQARPVSVLFINHGHHTLPQPTAVVPDTDRAATQWYISQWHHKMVLIQQAATPTLPPTLESSAQQIIGIDSETLGHLLDQWHIHASAHDGLSQQRIAVRLLQSLLRASHYHWEHRYVALSPHQIQKWSYAEEEAVA
ncbi:MAG: hypothetical protein H0X24_14060 [Ktedonobacterales bacterium]|nr:hypothetical protein [Ktedonobacterales bacterium]